MSFQFPVLNKETRRIMKQLLDEQESEMKLRVVSSPHMLEAYLVEAKRRAKNIEFLRSAQRHGFEDTPMCAALKSVYGDVITGRI